MNQLKGKSGENVFFSINKLLKKNYKLNFLNCRREKFFSRERQKKAPFLKKNGAYDLNLSLVPI